MISRFEYSTAGVHNSCNNEEFWSGRCRIGLLRLDPAVASSQNNKSIEMFLVYSESDSGVTYLALDHRSTVATFPVCSYDGQVCKLILLGKLHPMLYWRKFRKFSAVFFFFFVNCTVYDSTVLDSLFRKIA